jgi:hypothetical protein
MGEKSGQITDESAQPSPPRWRGAQSMSMVHRFNERCIELLCAVASSSTPGASAPAVAENLEHWVSLEMEARGRVAKMPFVILDAHFKSTDWWRRVARSVADPSLNEGAREHLDSYSENGLPQDASMNLMHEAIMFAWQLVSSDRTTAIMSFGMLAPVTKIIAELTPKDIREIATREHSAITIRWANDVQLWREFLVAANAGDDNKLAALHLQVKLLLCGDLPQNGT